MINRTTFLGVITDMSNTRTSCGYYLHYVFENVKDIFLKKTGAERKLTSFEFNHNFII